MLLKDLEKTNIKKGKYTKACWKSVKQVNGDIYEKVSKGVVRFVCYYNIKGVNKPQTTKVNINVKTIIKDILTFNYNTTNYLVHMATTNHHKPKSTYYRNGKEITKQEYELNVKPRETTSDKKIFQVKLENLISIG